MPLASLHIMCLDKIFGFLKEGIWTLSPTNPFSELTVSDVNRLMEMTLLHRRKDFTKMGDVILLLTSGKLMRLDMRIFLPEIEQDLIVKATQTRSAVSLQNFPSHSKEIFVFHLVRHIISENPHLEEFYSYIPPGFDVFLKCQNLRILKLAQKRGFTNFPVDLSVLTSLRNLEVFHLSIIDTNTIADILENCPNLISIGDSDSLDSLDTIYQRRLLLNLDLGCNLQLRRSVWGKESSCINQCERREYNSRFCDKVRSAVTLCPLVKELVFYVHVKEALNQLRFLKQLTLLRIYCDEFERNFEPHFVAMLQEIGPQLKHLSIIRDESLDTYVPNTSQPIQPLNEELEMYGRFETFAGIPVGVICDCCPHLESLELEICMFESTFPSRTSRNLPFKRLALRSMDEPEHESLLFLLSNCERLEELFLESVQCFDDALLSKVFKRNPFTALKVVLADDCNRLTREGYQMFLEKASSIETVLINSNGETYFYDVNRVFRDPNIRYLEDDFAYVARKEFFHRRLNEKRF